MNKPLQQKNTQKFSSWCRVWSTLGELMKEFKFCFRTSLQSLLRFQVSSEYWFTILTRIPINRGFYAYLVFSKGCEQIRGFIF